MGIKKTASCEMNMEYGAIEKYASRICLKMKFVLVFREFWHVTEL